MVQTKQVNKNSDLRLVVSLGSNYISGTPFTILFRSGRFGAHYDCSLSKDGVYTNCEEVGNGNFLCHLDNHNLPCGRLYADVLIYVPDTSMPDGNYTISARKDVVFEDECGDKYYIVLWNGMTDEFDVGQVTFNLLANVLKGDPFTYSDLTSEQKAELMKPATDAAEYANQVAGELTELKDSSALTISQLVSNASSSINSCNSATSAANTAAANANESAEVVNNLLKDVYGKSGVLSKGTLNYSSTDHTLTTLEYSGGYTCMPTSIPITLEAGDTIKITDNSASFELYWSVAYQDDMYVQKIKTALFNNGVASATYKNTTGSEIVVFTQKSVSGTYQITKDKNLIEKAEEATLAANNAAGFVNGLKESYVFIPKTAYQKLTSLLLSLSVGSESNTSLANEFKNLTDNNQPQ